MLILFYFLSYTEGDKEICTAVCDKEMLKNLKSLHSDVNIGIMECGKVFLLNHLKLPTINS